MKTAVWLGCIVLVLLGAASFGLAQTTELVPGTAVRVQSRALATGWNEGTFAPDEGCPSIALKQPTNAGHTKIRLSAIEKIQRSRGKGWQDLDLKTLLAGIPARCRETPAAADVKPVH